MPKETLQTGVPTEGNPALDLMTYLLTKKFGSEGEAERRIGEWNSTYANKTVGAFTLCVSEGIDVLGALDQVRDALEKEGLVLGVPGTGKPGDEIPYVWTKVELDAFIQRKMPEWKKELQVSTRQQS